MCRFKGHALVPDQKYSSDLACQEKYHEIPYSITGFHKTGHKRQFLPNCNYDVILKIRFSEFSYIFHNYIHFHHTIFRIDIICLKKVTGGSFA